MLTNSTSLFLFYTLWTGGVLGVAGTLIGLARLFKRDVSRVWVIYRSWLVMVPIVAICLLFGRTSTTLAVTLLSIASFHEYARVTRLDEQSGTHVAITMAAIIGSTMVLTLAGYRPFMLMPLGALTLLFGVSIVQDRPNGQPHIIVRAFLGYLLCGWLLLHLVAIVWLPAGFALLLFVLFAVQLTDVAAYNLGKLLGGVKLRRHISPNKTVSGALAALAVGLLMPWLLQAALPELLPLQRLWLGLIIGVGGPFGDLVMSLIKRDLGVKDMSGLIPGHGGLLDRVDSLLFVVPALFALVGLS